MQKTKFPAVLATFVVCFAMWLILTGSFAAQEMAAGAIVSLAVALFSARFFIHEHAWWLANPARLISCIGYWCGTFVAELVKANVNMAKICYGGCRKINPGIVRIPTALQSDYGIAALANSITLTPGTITMEVAEEDGQNYLYVHWIDVEETDPERAGEAIKGNLERGVRRIWK